MGPKNTLEGGNESGYASAPVGGGLKEIINKIRFIESFHGTLRADAFVIINLWQDGIEPGMKMIEQFNGGR